MLHTQIGRKSTVVVVATAFALATYGTITHPPIAIAETCGTNQSLQIGYSTNHWSGSQPYTYEGASAYITDAGGYVLCTSDHNGGTNSSTSWTMIFGANGYAQSGTMYRWGYGSCVKRWAEQMPPGGTFQDYYIGGCSTAGEQHRYWQQSIYVSGGWHIRSNIDTTIIRQSAFNPFGWTGRYHVAFDSETYYAQSHVPGSPTSEQLDTTMQIQRLDNNAWYTTCNNVYLGRFNNNPTRWANDDVSCDFVESWTR